MEKIDETRPLLVLSPEALGREIGRVAAEHQAELAAIASAVSALQHLLGRPDDEAATLAVADSLAYVLARQVRAACEQADEIAHSFDVVYRAASPTVN